MKAHLSETESMGFELGSHGLATFFAYAITAARNIFSNSDKIENEIDRKLIAYKLEDISEEKLTLKLKQIDY